MMVACIDIIRREIEEITPDQLDDLLNEMRRRQAHYMRQGLPSQDAAQRATQSVSRDMKLAAAIERRNAAINLRIRREMLDFVRTQFGDNPAEGLTALLAGSNKVGIGTRMSADAVQSALKGQYIGGLIGDLQRGGLFELFADGNLDRDVARALWLIDEPQELAKLPKEAKAIAHIVHRWQEKARLDANRAGAWIGKIKGYIVRQGHDADRLMRAGFEAWRNAILPRLDLERMFPDGVPEPADLERYLRETWTGIVTGIHESRPANADKMTGFKGPGNLAKKLSQERKLHFKSADDWFEYNREFGPGNLREAVLMGLSKQADATGLMRVLGTNPEFNLQSVFDALRQQLRQAGDLEKLKELERWGNPQSGWGRALYQEVSGRSAAPAGRMLATAGAIVRGWNMLTSLGGAVLSAATDIPVRAMELRYQGKSFLGSLADSLLAPFSRLLEGASATERKALLAELGQFSEGVSGLLGARFSAQDGVTGGIARMQRWFFKLNLLTPWTDVMRDSAILATSANIATFAGKAFDDLPEATRRLLGLYGIGDADWQVLSRATRTFEGRTFLSPEAVRELNPRAFADLAAERINTLKTGLVERIRKRLAADEREREWVEKRAAKMQEQLAEATQRLNERIARAEGKQQEALRGLQRRLVELYDGLDTASAYWSSVRDGQVNLSELRRAGVIEGQQRAEVKRLNSRVRAITRDLEAMKDSLDAAFREKWFGKESELERLLADERTSPEALSEKIARFDQLFTEANAALTNRVEGLGAKAAERIQALRAKIENASNRMRDAAAIWQQAASARPRFGILRQAGVTEGRAREAMKGLKAKAREIGREVERLKKELNKEFLEHWSARQEDLVAFSERIDQRIAERAEATARELGDLEPQIARILEEAREDLAVKLQTLLTDRMNYAVISPDARSRAITTAGQQRGTAAGEIARAVMQFKSFGIAFTQRTLGREAFGYGARRLSQIRARELQGIAMLIASTTAFGYLAMAAKDLSKGKTPRPVDDWKTWAAAMQQGGGFGIYGDFLFGEASRFGSSPLATLSGPTVGKVEDVWNLIQAAKQGKDPSAKAFRFLVSNTPFINLFYTKLALDYAIFYQIQEAMNPGYLRRMERRIEKDTGQEFLLRPSEAAR